jgi:hypothetical protein
MFAAAAYFADVSCLCIMQPHFLIQSLQTAWSGSSPKASQATASKSSLACHSRPADLVVSGRLASFHGLGTFQLFGLGSMGVV